MYEAHDALICIADGAYVDQQEPRRRLTPQHYFKSQEEMVTLFADLPEAIENTVEIAKRCAFKAYRRDPILPKFADDEVAELRRNAKEGLRSASRLSRMRSLWKSTKNGWNLNSRLSKGWGFPGYFLIVADFINGPRTMAFLLDRGVGLVRGLSWRMR